MSSTLVRPRATHAGRAFASCAIALIVLALSLTVQGLSNPAEAGTPGGAFVWADQPTTAHYTPNINYQTNSVSPATPTTIDRLGAGNYSVRFAGLAVVGGTVHVTAYGTTTHRCKVASWGPEQVGVSDAQRVAVRCTTASGTPADTYFTATFTNKKTAFGKKLGYVRANQPTVASYIPALAYQANSSGGTNTVSRGGVGSYNVQMPGLGAAGGHVQVTAMGANGDFCKVTGWYPSGTTELIGVACFTPVGSPVDAQYTLTYADQTNILGLSGDTYPSAYAWADQPMTASYAPSPSYRFPAGSAKIATRAALGTYGIDWSFVNDLESWGNVQVTAYGAGNATCKVAWWNPTDGIQVRCFTPGGAPSDSRYDVTFTGPYVPA